MCLRLLFACLMFAAAGAVPAAGQGSGSIEVSLTIVEPVAARVGGEEMTVERQRGGVRVSAPLTVKGGGSPIVTVRQGGESSTCQAAASAEAEDSGRARLTCFVPDHAKGADGVTRVPVTLVLSPAT